MLALALSSSLTRRCLAESHVWITGSGARCLDREEGAAYKRAPATAPGSITTSSVSMSMMTCIVAFNDFEMRH